MLRDNHKQNAYGLGVTQFGRVHYELDIDVWCPNTSQAKGRVERSNLTLQDRLVKELRLEGISTMSAVNAYAPAFMADFNQRFAKSPRSDAHLHRPVRQNEDLDLVFTARELRTVHPQLGNSSLWPGNVMTRDWYYFANVTPFDSEQLTLPSRHLIANTIPRTPYFVFEPIYYAIGTVEQCAHGRGRD